MSASKAELWTQLKNAVKIEDELFKAIISNTPNFLSLIDTLQQSYEGDHIGTTDANFASMRSSLSSLMGSNSRLQALILELAKQGYNSISTSVDIAIDDIFDGMVAATETVRHRDWTYGAVTPYATNDGNGTVYRLTVDKAGYEIDAGAYPGGGVKIRITSDKNAGRAAGSEQALIYGNGVTPTDELQLGAVPDGSLLLTAKRAADGLLNNGSFSSYSGDATSGFTMSGWTIATSTAMDIDTSVYYRLDAGVTTGTAVKLTDNNTLTQYRSDFSSSPDTSKPFFLIVRYRRDTSCDGTMTIRVGSQTAAVTMAGATNDQWADLTVGVGASSNGWYDNFKEDSGDKGFRVQIALASRTTGNLYLDEIILVQPAEFDGKFYALTAGENDYLTDDYFTFTDNVANTGRIQTTISRLFPGKHLPHTSAAETYADA